MMKHFLLRTLVFFLIPFSYMLIMYIYNYNMHRGMPLVFEEHITSLYIGDSRFGAGVNDSILSNSRNISMPGEHYLVTFYKVKQLIALNPHIDTVYISFSYSNLAESMDYKFQKMPQYVDECAQRLFPFTWHKLLSMPINKMSALKTIVKNACLLPTSDIYGKSIGEFESMTSTMDSVKNIYAEKTIYKSFSLGSNGDSNAELQLEYLDSIRTCAELNVVTLGIIAMPLHIEYLNRVPEFYKSSYDSVKKVLMADPNVLFIDYQDSISHYTFFENHDHLNIKGSDKFSKSLSKYLNTIKQ